MAEGGEELQEVIRELELRGARVEGLQTVYRSLVQGVEDSTSGIETLNSLRERGEDSEILLPLRGGAFVRASLESVDEVLVSMDDVVVEGSLDEAVGDLENRRDELRERMEEVQSSLQEERRMLQALQVRAQSLASSGSGQGPGFTAG
ncbi:MAG: Prefoldin subunit alpha [Methanonatronarchaeales archaeon]|nr:Prefoldin subunit alpha [Methanonatronarchaeales archaeon]